MSEEKKCINNEEPREGIKNLTEEDLEQVNGGGSQIIVASGNTDWKSDKLPSEPGNYKLRTDIPVGT